MSNVVRLRGSPIVESAHSTRSSREAGSDSSQVISDLGSPLFAAKMEICRAICLSMLRHGARATSALLRRIAKRNEFAIRR